MKLYYRSMLCVEITTRVYSRVRISWIPAAFPIRILRFFPNFSQLASKKFPIFPMKATKFPNYKKCILGILTLIGNICTIWCPYFIKNFTCGAFVQNSQLAWKSALKNSKLGDQKLPQPLKKNPRINPDNLKVRLICLNCLDTIKFLYWIWYFFQKNRGSTNILF